MSPKCEKQAINYDYDNPTACDLRIIKPGNKYPEKNGEDCLRGSNSFVNVPADHVELQLIPRPTENGSRPIWLMDVKAEVECAQSYSMTVKDRDGATVYQELVIKTIGLKSANS